MSYRIIRRAQGQVQTKQRKLVSINCFWEWTKPGQGKLKTSAKKAAPPKKKVSEPVSDSSEPKDGGSL
jgi:hypothetical protein